MQTTSKKVQFSGFDMGLNWR